MPLLRRSALSGLLLVMTLASAAPAQVGGPPTPPVTIWQFLGIPQGIRKVQGATRNRRGNHPNLEPKPPLKAIADPANLESNDASIKKAAEVKQAEDLKKQKIKAVKYLASIGCGCYDADGGVTDALVASMGDCTEDVRYETIKAISDNAQGECCSKCGKTCCCNQKILLELAKIAYERDEHGCYLEPSARVRQAATEALRICCPNSTSPVIVEPPAPQQLDPRESSDSEEPEDDRELESTPSTPPAPGGEELPMGDDVAVVAPSGNGDGASVFGVIVHHSPDHALAHVHFDQPNLRAAVGSFVGVYGQVGEKRRLMARLRVVDSFPGSANVTGEPEALAAIAQGDVVLCPLAGQPVQASADHALVSTAVFAESQPSEAPPLEPPVVTPPAPEFERDYTDATVDESPKCVVAASSETLTAAAAPVVAAPVVTRPMPSAATPRGVTARRPVTAVFMR